MRRPLTIKEIPFTLWMVLEMKKLFLSGLAFGVLAAVAAVAEESVPSVEGVPAAKAVIVLVHGLNLKPEKMNALADFLRAQGADVLPVTLSGHGGTMEEFKKASRDIWIGEMQDAFGRAGRRAKENNAPVYFVGYSLGALVGLDFLNSVEGENARCGKMVLLAPAISIRGRSYLLKLLGMFPSMVIPSLSPEDYRAHSGTPMAAYKALFQSVSSLEKEGLARSNVPTLVLVDPKDELVSAEGLGALTRQFRLDQWKLLEVTNAGSPLKKKYHHLIVDENALGTDQWRQMRDAIKDHLGL